jgi:hypothetical protein
MEPLDDIVLDEGSIFFFFFFFFFFFLFFSLAARLAFIDIITVFTEKLFVQLLLFQAVFVVDCRSFSSFFMTGLKLKKSSDGEPEKNTVRRGSPSLTELLITSSRAISGSKSFGSRLGPRRALSMIPMDKKKQYEENESKLQNLAVLSNWHIPFEKLKFMEQLGKGSFKVVYRGMKQNCLVLFFGGV